MRPQNIAVLTILLAVVVATSVVGAYILLSPATLPASLPIPAGTVFSANESAVWVAHFTAGPAGGVLRGAWTAYNGWGFIGLAVVNGTVSKPPSVAVCPLVVIAWKEWNGTVDLPVDAGPHTMFWTAGNCSSAQEIVVTQAIRLAAS